MEPHEPDRTRPSDRRGGHRRQGDSRCPAERNDDAARALRVFDHVSGRRIEKPSFRPLTPTSTSMLLTDNADVRRCRRSADGPVCRAPPSPVSGYQKRAGASRNFPRAHVLNTAAVPQCPKGRNDKSLICLLRLTVVSSNLRPHPVSFSARVVSASASRIVLLPDETVQETAELFIRAVSPQIIGRSLVRHHSIQFTCCV